jgi:hypothetical protein
MTKATFLRNNVLLGILALSLLAAALLMAHLRGGVSMEVGELLLHVQPHQEGGLMVSFMQAP